jgi:hypothetical protein
MADDEIVWPVGTTDRDPDLSSRPMIFAPRGFLVAILPDAEEAERAAARLREAGFTDRKLRIFTSQQILDDYAHYTARQSMPRRVVTALTDDEETLSLYHRYARDGCCALWVQVADGRGQPRHSDLSGYATLHIRHDGHRRQSDFHLQHPRLTETNDETGRFRCQPRSSTT